MISLAATAALLSRAARGRGYDRGGLEKQPKRLWSDLHPDPPPFRGREDSPHSLPPPERGRSVVGGSLKMEGFAVAPAATLASGSLPSGGPPCGAPTRSWPSWWCLP